ncbi:DMT family transporter [Segeticoccus rhizosphaerae]|jgi:drug/metabolite transporter (DMT)-like permease|uniref:DMT family transporter n=1 Tax=Segeticoccus rhizosphaerae TaxID=1104777 RepID=UPI0010C0C381|nr:MULTISPECIES: DMT family transporter [Intrasporangiaceae]
MFLATLIGLAAAFLFATAAFLQQQGARSVLTERLDEPSSTPSAFVSGLLRGVRQLPRQKVWLTGWLTNLAGFFAQAVALHFGSVALVQPLLSTQLLFTMMLLAVSNRRTPPPRYWLAGAAIGGGLTLLLTVDGATPLSAPADRPRVVIAALSAVGLIALLVAAAARRPMLVRSILMSVAAGFCFAFTAVFMKLTTDDLLTMGAGGTARDWPGYCLALSALSGVVLEQAAFATGPLTWSVAAMNITNPTVSYLLGILAFQASPPTQPGALASIAAAGLLIALGVAGLAHGLAGDDRHSWRRRVSRPA